MPKLSSALCKRTENTKQRSNCMFIAMVKLVASNLKFAVKCCSHFLNSKFYPIRMVPLVIYNENWDARIKIFEKHFSYLGCRTVLLSQPENSQTF